MEDATEVHDDERHEGSFLFGDSLFGYVGRGIEDSNKSRPAAILRPDFPVGAREINQIAYPSGFHIEAKREACKCQAGDDPDALQ